MDRPLCPLGSLNPSQAMSFISVVLASQHRDWQRDGNKLKMSFAFSLRWQRFVLSLDHSGAYFVTWPLLCIFLLLLLLILCILLHKLTHLSMLPGTAGWGDRTRSCPCCSGHLRSAAWPPGRAPPLQGDCPRPGSPCFPSVGFCVLISLSAPCAPPLKSPRLPGVSWDKSSSPARISERSFMAASGQEKRQWQSSLAM